MTITEARQKLDECRRQAKIIYEEQKRLKNFILSKNVPLDIKINERKIRDFSIYKMRLQGLKYSKIADHFNISGTQARNIFRQVKHRIKQAD